MVRIAFIVLALAAGLAGCAGLGAWRDDRAASPSAAIPDRLEPLNRLEPLSGHWQGTIDETAGWFHQGTLALDVTLAPDGTWSGTIGKAKAAGTAEVRGRHLILRGTARSTQDEDAVYLRLTGDDTRRWGETVADFGGRPERASVSLKKTG
jgi:hypothetical protein